MNDKNLVVLSENDLENISGGVNKKALGDAVEYGTAAVSTVVLSVVGQVLGVGVSNEFILKNGFLYVFGEPTFYIPGFGILGGAGAFIEGITNKARGEILTSATVFSTTVGGGVGGWFAGKAIGKKIRKKLGL